MGVVFKFKKIDFQRMDLPFHYTNGDPLDRSGMTPYKIFNTRVYTTFGLLTKSVFGELFFTEGVNNFYSLRDYK